MMKRLCGEGLCARIAGLLLVTGFVVALVFDSLIATAGSGLIIAGGVLIAITLEGSVAPSPAVGADELDSDDTQITPAA